MDAGLRKRCNGFQQEERELLADLCSVGRTTLTHTSRLFMDTRQERGSYTHKAETIGKISQAKGSPQLFVYTGRLWRGSYERLIIEQSSGPFAYLGNTHVSGGDYK